jgi:hypothetical protein
VPRSVRIEYQDAVYHVMCRGDRREAIFLDQGNREIFLATSAAQYAHFARLATAPASAFASFSTYARTDPFGLRTMARNCIRRLEAKDRRDGRMQGDHGEWGKAAFRTENPSNREVGKALRL